jgi:aminopeptidase N
LCLIKVVDNEDNTTPLEVNNVDDQQIQREIVTITLKKVLVVGKTYKISMKFTSYLNDELRGFYRSKYEENGVTK